LKGTQISFRRWLFDDLRIAWNVIWQDALKFQLTTNDDSLCRTRPRTAGAGGKHNALGGYGGRSCYDYKIGESSATPRQ